MCQAVNVNIIFRLKDVIVQFEHLGIETHFSTEFPDSITLNQTVSVWKHVVLFQENIKTLKLV